MHQSYHLSHTDAQKIVAVIQVELKKDGRVDYAGA